MNKILKAVTRVYCQTNYFLAKAILLLLVTLTVACTRSNAQVTLTASAGIPAGSYTTLKEAFDAINLGNHHGNIIININANTNEGSTPATLNSEDADPAAYTSVLIQAGADNVVISGNPAAGFAVIQLNGADNVTINGDNPNSGGTNQNLTINNTAASTSIGNSCIRVATSAATISADNISILNCILNGNVTSGNASAVTSAAGSANISFGIYAGGNGGATANGAPAAIVSETANPAIAGTSIASFTAQNNVINQCGRAIVFNAANAAVSNGIDITQNTIGTAGALGIYPYNTPATTVYACAVWVAGGNNISISTNNIRNVISYLPVAVSGIELNSSNAGTITVNDNNISGVVNNNTVTALPTSGIVLNSTGSGYTIAGNDISTIENSGAAAAAPAGAIRINSATAAGTIASNKLSGVFNRNTGGFPAQGINLALAANATIIQNNFVSDIMNVGTSSFLNTRNANGILLNSGSSHKIYHNSINLFGNSTATGTNAINCLAITSNSQTGIDIRNNIFSNTVTGGSGTDVHSCLFFTFGLSAAMGLTLNNNGYYTGSTAGLHCMAFAGGVFYSASNIYKVANFDPSTTAGATNWRSFASGLGVGSSELYSFGTTAAAPFTTATDLHIPAATVTALESGGAAVGISTDIDGAARNASTPDIGADEFNGVVTDAVPPVISYTALQNTCSPGNRLLLANITDASGVPVSGTGLPVLYWAINGAGQLPVTGAHVSGSQYQFIFGNGVVLGDVVTYYIVAQDNLGNVIAQPSVGATGYTTDPPAAATPPTTLSSYIIQGTLAAGTYDVGVSGVYDYPTITAAINAYNNSCPGGAIVFRLMDAAYPSETYPIVISNPQASAINTLSIVPNTGVAVSVSGSNSSTLFKLNGSDYVTFDGLNAGGSSLTVTNTNAASSATVFWIASAGAADGASNNSLLNCTISGSGSSTSLGCIMAGSGTSLGGTAAASNSNNTISGCILKAAQYGIYQNGYTGSFDQNWVISNNTIGSVIASEKMGFRGISLMWLNNFTVTDNTISGVVMNSSAAATGIAIFNNATNGTISKNNITDIRQNSVGGASYGIYLGSTVNASILAINNNFVSDIFAIGNATLANNAAGIMINSGGGYSIYYNSVNLTAAASASTSTTAALRIANAVTFANGLNVRNNIFSNTTAVGNRFSIYNGSTAAIFSSIDYNDYYSGASPVLAFQGGNIATFGAWQTATADDARSMSINPLFVSATDAHLQATSPMNARGITIAGLTTDIDGDVRPATPDMGADEILATDCAGIPVGGTIASLTTAFCGAGSSAYLTATGYSATNGLSYQWQSSIDNFTTPVNLAGQTVPSNAFTGAIAVTTSYRLKVTCANGGGTGYSNVLVININTPVIAGTTAASRCGIGPVSLAATSTTLGATLNWYSSATGGTSLGTGSPFTTPSIAATTTYYVAASLGTSTGKVGPANPTAVGGTIGTQTVNWETYFNVLQPTTLVSVDIFPNVSGAASSLLLRNSSGTLLATIPYTTTVSGGFTAQSIAINFALAAGNGYYIEGAMPAGGLQRNTSGAAYPYSSSVINITGNGFLNSYYMCFYNFQFSSSCASARTAVTATVTPAPAVSAVASPAVVCAGSNTTLTASSSNASYSYVWTPGNLPGISVVVSPAATTTYTVRGTDLTAGPNSGCVAIDTVLVTTSQLPSTVTVSPATGTVCINSPATLLTASGGFLNNISALTENFNAATDNWTKINNSTGGVPANAAWTLRPNGYIYDALTFNSNDASQFYLSNSADQGSGSLSNTILQSPAFSLASYTTVNLSFWHYFKYQGGEEAIVEVSTDGGTWTALAGGTYTSNQGSSNGFVNANLNMDAYAGQPIVYIRFRYSNGAAVWYWAIDNVNVSGNVNTLVTWSQAPVGPNAMFTDAGASIPYVAGTDANSIYVQPGVTTVFTATATGPGPSNCSRSGTATITVTPAVSVTIVASENPACPSAVVTFTATVVNGGPAPFYQWQVSGANVGTNSPTYTYSPANLDQVKVIVTGNGTCTYGNPATSNIVTMSVTGPIAVAVNITANPGNFVCEGVPVTFTATATNGGAAPVYQWKKNGINVGTNSPTYVYSFLYAENGDAITCDITSNSICVSGSPTASSSQILMTVDDNGPTGAVIGIFAASTTVCAGTTVTVRATPTRQGHAPTYEFFLNNISQGIQLSNDFVFTPLNGDKVKVKLTSNYTCLTGPNTATSNTLTMTVLAAAPAGVTLSNSATLCSGSPITFTASATNGGAGPIYDFLLNGTSVQVGSGNTYVLAAPVNGNTVQVVLTSNFSCVTTNPASSAIITVALNASPTVTAAVDCANLLPGSGQNATITATATAGSGAITNYQWVLSPSINVGANSPVYTTNVTGSYTVVVTNSNGCTKTLGTPVVITGTGAALAAGTYIIPGTGCGSFDKISSAVNYINTYGVAGAVIFNIAPAYTETAPVGGFAITATGTAVNTIIFQRNGAGANPVITAGLQVAGNNNDAVFKIIGGDYITIRDLTIKENAGNTVTAAGAANTMTEWGVALLYATAANGPNNNTILNDSISLNKAYPNSFGIYSNMRHGPVTLTTNLDLATATGGQNKIYGNAISNVNNPIWFIGGTSILNTAGNDIGGSSAATANTITDWGTNTGNSGAAAFFSVPSTISGIYAANQASLNISWNNLTSATAVNAGVTGFRGILTDFITNAAGGNYTNSISNNTIVLNSAATTGAFEAIAQANGSGFATAIPNMTINITNNTIGMILTGAASGSIVTGISNLFPSGVLNISNNIIKGNTSTATTGGFTGISNTAAVATAINLNNNQFGDVATDAITFSAATNGTVRAISNSGAGAAAVLSVNGNTFTRFVHTVAAASVHTYISSTATPATQNINNNSFTGLSLNSSAAITCISSTTASANKTITGNTFTGITGGAGLLTMISAGGGSTLAAINTNNIGNSTANSISGTGAVTGIELTNIAGGIATVSANIISGLSSTGAGAVSVAGINTSAPTVTITGNSIDTLSAAGVAASVYGILVSAGTTVNASQNRIHTLNGTGTGNSSSNGIAVTAGTTVNLFKNKIYNLSQQGAGSTLPLVNGISLSGGTTVTVYNNFISELKAPVASLAVDAIRGIAVTSALVNSNYNVYYNSIYLNAISSGTNFGTAGIFHTGDVTATTATLNLRNNIIVNESVRTGTGKTAAFRRGSALANLVNYGSASNNNSFYAGIAGVNNLLFYDGTNSDQTIIAFQARVATPARDVASIAIRPTFVNIATTPYDLHLQVAFNCSFDGQGNNAVILVPDDIDGDSRSVSNPFITDIGADEFNGTGGSIGVWKGVNSDWMDINNWCDALPTAGTNVTIPAAAAFYPIITTTGPVANSITIAGGGSITITGAGKLNINGSISNSGTFNVADGSIELQGAVAQTIPAGAFQNNDLKNLVINNAAASLSGALNLYGKLSFTGSNRVFATAGNLTLKSNAAGTASVGDITNAGAAAGNSITGDVTVERFVTARRAWRFLSVPTQHNLQTIHEAWQENQAPNATTPAGFGIQITKDSLNWNTTGFDLRTTPGPSMKYYVPAGNSWKGISSTIDVPGVDNGKFVTGRGYIVLVRGDRTVNTFPAAATTTVLRDKGALVTGTFAAPAIGAGLFAAVGNPYASAVDFTKLTKASLDDVYYLWDPYIGSLGGYVTFAGPLYTPTPQLSYTTNKFIESGQAFFVHSSGAAGSLSFTEPGKVDGSYLVTRPAGAAIQLRTNLYLVDANGRSLFDGVLSDFDATYNYSVDGNDAIKLVNFGENLGIRRSNRILSVERMPELVKTDTIFYNLAQMRVQHYQFEFIADNINRPGLAAFLEDSYLAVKTAVGLSDTTRIDFNIINDPGSYAPDRFRLVFKELAPVPVTFTSVRANRQVNNILVEWKVENELNIDHYEVEKSADGQHFTKVNSQPARGNNQGAAIQYSWLDTSPLDGANFYRIRSISIVSVSKLSQVVKVNMDKLPAEITVFPNPIGQDGMINLSLENEPAGNYQVSVMNGEGQTVLMKTLNHPGGNTLYSIKMEQTLAHGNYLVKVVGAGSINLALKIVY